MRLAVLSDVHANLEALEAVLADVDANGVQAMACLGDFVGYGASPNECIDLLRPRVEEAVAGNHDVAACGRLKLGDFNNDAATAARWTEQRLTEDNRRWLAKLPYAAAWRGTRLVHASPLQPEQWHYVLSPADAEEEMQAYDEPLCFIGHSHFPCTFGDDGHGAQYTRAADVAMRLGHRYLVNVPSVGQPRDGDARGGWLLWDEDARTLHHRRVTYDVAGAMQRIRDAGLPPFLAERLQWGE